MTKSSTSNLVENYLKTLVKLLNRKIGAMNSFPNTDTELKSDLYRIYDKLLNLK